MQEGRLLKATVLIVDDDPEVTTTFSRWLRLEGYDVRTAPDGEAALGQIRGADAVILDARMPILDGLGFLKRARLANDHVPVVVVTGDYLIDERIMNEFTRLGAKLLFKPLWVEDLVAITVELLRATAAA